MTGSHVLSLEMLKLRIDVESITGLHGARRNAPSESDQMNSRVSAVCIYRRVLDKIPCHNKSRYAMALVNAEPGFCSWKKPLLPTGSGYSASSISGEQWRAPPRILLKKIAINQHARKALCAVTASPMPRTFEHEKANVEIDIDMNRIMTTGRLVQWYPGHIAKAERDLKEQLQLVDVVIEVRDARIPLSTGHPMVDTWIEGKKKILVLNREDMITTADKNAWASYFSRKGLSVVYTDGQRGKGAMKLTRQACSVASGINMKRRAKGLLPRSVRAAVIGYPNVGKSSIINRLLKRRVCDAAPRPGVTREIKWSRIGDGIDLLDSPGILPMKLEDQAAAVKLAICNDIGEGSYAVAGVASVLVERLKRIPAAGAKVLSARYKLDAEDLSGESFLEELAQVLFRGDTNQAASRVLLDFRKGKFGWVALESPPSLKESSIK